MTRFALATLCSALSVLTACAPDGGEGVDRGESATAEQVAEAQPAASEQTDVGQGPAEASLTAADIDRWQRGMEAELAAVREAGTRFKAAKNANDSLSAMMAVNETSTRATGAASAFPPEVIEALRARAVELRKEETALVAERLRAAGMAR